MTNKILKHTSLSLSGNVPVYEYSNQQRAKMYDKYDPFTSNTQQYGINQKGKGFWGDVIGGAAGGLGAIVGSIGGPIGSGALGAAAGYSAKKFATEQLGLGYQYKSKTGARGMWQTSNNALGPVSQNMATL